MLAYFTGTYPSLTETFIKREISYLKKNNIPLKIFSVKKAQGLSFSSSEKKSIDSNVIFARPYNVFIGIFAVPYYFVKKPIVFLQSIKLIFGLLKYYSIIIVFKSFVHLYYSLIFSLYIKIFKIKHIHAHFSSACTMALFCNYFENVTFSFTVHASGDIYVNPILIDEKINRASFVVADINYNKEYLNLITDYKYNKKIVIVHNGVIVEDKFNYDINKNKTIELLSIGSFTYFKGFDTLIKAVSMLKKIDLDFHLNIIGDGAQRSVIEKLVNIECLEDKISLLGALPNDQIKSYNKKADIFILPSVIYVNGMRDGIPTVCAEAMGACLPVISTYISGIPDLIQSGVSGLLVPEKSPKDLFNAIKELIENPELRNRYAINGYETVFKYFNKEKTNKELLELLNGYI